MVGYIIILDSIDEKEVIAPAVSLLVFSFLFFLYCFVLTGFADRQGGQVDKSRLKDAREDGLSRV